MTPTGDEMAERGTDRWANEARAQALKGPMRYELGFDDDGKVSEVSLMSPLKTTPKLDGPSEVVKRKTKIKGVRVVYDVGGGIATRDHPTAQRWEVTKHGQLVLRDKHRKQVARYRQFVWRSVVAGDVREVGGNA